MHSLVGSCYMYTYGELVGVPIHTISGCHLPKIIHFTYLSAFLLAAWHMEHVLTTSGMYYGVHVCVYTCREWACVCAACVTICDLVDKMPQPNHTELCLCTSKKIHSLSLFPCLSLSLTHAYVITCTHVHAHVQYRLYSCSGAWCCDHDSTSLT